MQGMVIDIEEGRRQPLVQVKAFLDGIGPCGTLFALNFLHHVLTVATSAA
jgi:hypothetical protein